MRLQEGDSGRLSSLKRWRSGPTPCARALIVGQGHDSDAAGSSKTGRSAMVSGMIHVGLTYQLAVEYSTLVVRVKASLLQPNKTEPPYIEAIDTLVLARHCLPSRKGLHYGILREYLDPLCVVPHPWRQTSHPL